MRDDQNPLALAYPRAVRACVRLREWRTFCFKIARGSFIVLIVGICLWPIAVVAFWVLALSVTMCLVFAVLRLAIIALFFVRYSLGQLMTVILTGAACVTAMVQFPGPWKALPGMVLVILALFVAAFIAAYDPEDPLFTTDFIRKIYGPQDGGAGDPSRDREGQHDEQERCQTSKPLADARGSEAAARSAVDRGDDRGRVPRA